MGERKLGILVIGAGWVSTQHIAAYAANPLTEVIAISSRTVESAERRAAESGLDAGCYDDVAKALSHDGVDIVSVCSPQHLHAEHTIAAADAGKHIVVEKPVAMDLAQMRAMAHAIDAAGVKTVVSFVLRWNPLFQTLKAMIADGAIGEVYSVEADYLSYCGAWWAGWEFGRSRAAGGSAMLVAGCHAVDALRWFAAPGEAEAARAVEVFGYAGGRRKGKTRQYNPMTNTWSETPPMEYDGLEMALVRFDNGVVGKVSTNFECIQPYAFPLRIFGDAGTVRDNRLWSHQHPEQNDWIEIPGIRPDSADVTHHPFQGQLDHFIDCIRADTESHCNFADAMHTHEIVFAAQQCYQTGQPVSLPPA